MDRSRKVIAAIAAICLSCFHLYIGAFGQVPAHFMRAVHLMFGLVMVFTLYPFDKERAKAGKSSPALKKISYVIDAICLVIGVYVCMYFMLEYENLAYRGGMYNKMDIIVSVLGILIVVEGARRTLGAAMPIIALVFFTYAYWGKFVPGGFLRHRGFSMTWSACYNFLTTDGIFGTTLNASASYAFLFVLFAAALELTGGGEFFLNFAHAVCGRFRGGPAKVAVVGSGLMGMISGSAVANVAGTGCITIPMMKKMGLDPADAGAVESVASSGGLIMPPVMGAAAFIMAEYLNTSYASIMKAAILPAIIYYLACFAAVDFMSARLGLKGLAKEELPQLKECMRDGWRYAIPLCLLVYLMIGPQLTATKSAFWGTVCLVGIHLVYLAFKKTSIKNIGMEVVKILIAGGEQAVTIITACSCAGIVCGSVSLTSLGFKLSAMLVHVGESSLLLLLVLTALTSIILGMGLPVSACYVLLAVLAAPAMVDLGINEFAAHLFVLYYGVLSNITPPVALAAYVAGGIAETKPVRVAIHACKLGVVSFIVPFMFVYSPSLLLQGDLSAFDIVSVFVTAIIGSFAISAGSQGYFLRRNKKWESLVLLCAAPCMLYPGTVTDLIGLALTAVIFAIQFADVKKSKNAAVAG